MKGRLSDVAAAAGTSTKTASRVLNGDPRVAPETRDRVRLAMVDLGYQVDAVARSLRTGVDETIAVVVPTIGDPFFASMIEEIERETYEDGTKLLVATNSRDPEEEQRVIHGLLARRVAGIIVTPYTADYSFLSTVATPVVFLDRRPEGPKTGAVIVEDEAWGYRATAHLHSYGHTRIAIVTDHLEVKTSQFRLDGYRRAQREFGLKVNPEWELTGCTRAEDAHQAIVQLLDSPDQPTAIFSARSETTVGVVQALHEIGRTDVALVSFGDFSMSSLLKPGITAIDHSPVGLAQLALARLRHRMNGEQDDSMDYVMKMSLLQRGSGEIPAPDLVGSSRAFDATGTVGGSR